MDKRIKKIQSYLKENRIDLAFVTTPDNIFYFSGFRSNPHERLLGLVIFQDIDPFMICPKMEVSDAKASGWPFDVIGHSDTDQPWELLANEIQSRAKEISAFAIEKGHLTVERYEALQSRFPHVRFVSIDEQINRLRVIKDEVEIEKLKKAAELADFAIEVGVNAVKKGITELEIVHIIENAIKEKGCSMSFETTVLSGPKAASPHGTPGNRKIQKGDFVLFDLGVVYEGYCSDITRTVAFGEITEEQRKIYETVKRSNEETIKAVKPGVRCMDLDKISRDIITEAGYGEYYTHRLGHGLGISVHEFPSVAGTNELPLKPGMVFTIEPGIYKADTAGVRIEDDVVVTEDGVEVLTKYPKELIIVR
ncbi:M24 family metallopeptidase [Ureibacillus terrenus]|uniref:Aminopeptidase P family protein n=1 Tax=Ureibacillus terrenus TaxID=118246 RepID=A0A540V1E1_9BACL|nr:Xaa-Pro peptidase family protein [Ureibacillus terrenus]TQE90569.1 aminopeptidase P family protein [Ureibacillus terrenus]